MHGGLNKVQIEIMPNGERLIYAEAGVASPKVARFAATHGLIGAEFLAGIPGTVGGALAMGITSGIGALVGGVACMALFLVVGKRQWELQNAGDLSSSEHRPALASYRREGLDFLFVVTALSTVAAYSAYTVVPSTISMHGKPLAITIPFVVLGVARYVRLVYRRGGGGNPTQALLIDDPWILLIVLGWVAAAAWTIYAR